MKVISRPRGAGKTTALVEMSAQTGSYIVTKDHHTARYTADLAKKMGLQIPFPLTFKEFLDHRWSSRIKGFLLDDVDLLLLHILSHDAPIEAMTISTGNVYGPDNLRETLASMAQTESYSPDHSEMIHQTQVDHLLRGWLRYFLETRIPESEWESELRAVIRARAYQGDKSLQAPAKSLVMEGL